MNCFTGTGRLGRDAETRYTQGGTAVANMAIAVDVGYGDNKSTLWLDAALFGKRAESGLIQYLTKGKQVAVSGEIGTRQYQKQDGSQGFSVTLRINEIDLIGGQDQQSGGQPRQQPQSQQGMNGPTPNDFDDQIPFLSMHWMMGG